MIACPRSEIPPFHANVAPCLEGMTKGVAFLGPIRLSPKLKGSNGIAHASGGNTPKDCG